MSARPPRTLEPTLRARLLVVVGLVATACVGGQVAERISEPARPWRAEQGATHGWWGERGLVVPHASFPADCTLCHVAGDWSTLRGDFTFDHAAETGYVLEGAHAAAQCLRCHNDRGPAGEFSQRGCVGCHVDVHQGQRGTSCQECHEQSSWRVDEALLAHARTRFPLVGPHAAAACRDCHVGIDGGVLEPLDTACASCHAGDLARATNPDHRALGWTASCEDCHQVSSTFAGAGFVHAGFALTGGHAALDCSQCHVGNQFAGTSSDCVSCHAQEFQATTDPPHVALSFPMACQQCHSTSSWEGAAFDHSSWALTGAHRQAGCSSCHGGGTFAGTATDCVGCHLGAFNATTDPSHSAAGFSNQCQDCHGTSAWEPSTFDHGSYALTGAHASTSCNECHGGGVFAGTPTECVACHLGAFNATTNPDHVAMGFPTSCQQCHGTLSWLGASFDHSTWELTGAHAATSCNECHGGGVFAGTPTLCVGCHQEDYDDTTDPPHMAAGFGTTCQECHTTVTWEGAEFDHSAWELTGAHAATSCSECHGSGVFAGTATDCYACHAAEYAAALDPNHVALGFPTSCQQCHGTTTWSGATFNHTWFPIQGGDHGGLTCTECHQVPGDPNQFSCTHCHEHRESEMASKHDDVPGYIWVSSACYQCHPNGQEHARRSSPPILRRRRDPLVPPAPNVGKPRR